MQVRKATEHDTAAIQRILNEVWRTRPENERAYFSPRVNDQVWVVIADAEVIGFAASQQRPWHPRRQYLSLHVLPTMRRRGAATMLWRTLEVQTPNPLLQTAAPDSFNATRAFLERIGFKAVMSTWTVEFNPADVITRLPRPQPLEIHSFARRPELTDELAQLHHRLYVQSHQFNPPLDASLEQMRRAYMDPDDLDPELMFVAFDQIQPIGVTSLRGEPDALELGWTGVVGHDTDLTLALVARIMQEAVKRGHALVSAEFDSLDPHAMRILDTLNTPRAEAWITYQN